MEIENKICANCENSFESNHGNRIYCSEECYNKFKTKKLRENNKLIVDFRHGFLHNYKLFQELLPQPGNISIPLLNLLKKRFDQDAYYGTVLDNEGNQWHRVNEYCFMIRKDNDQPTLYLYKP